MTKKIIILVALTVFAWLGFVSGRYLQTQLTLSSIQNRLTELGIRFEKPTSPPIISEAKAIEFAKSYGTKHTAEIGAQYVLFSDTQYRNVPAWVVTFRGVNYHGSKGNPLILKYNVVINVVINALTGEYMEEIDYGTD